MYHSIVSYISFSKNSLTGIWLLYRENDSFVDTVNL